MPAKTAEKTTERWHYAGRRLDGKGRTLHAWRTPDGSVVLFSKAPGVAIGAVYDVDVSRDGERTTMYGSPRFAGRSAELELELDDELVAGWQAEDAAARHDAEQAREEKRAEKDPELEAALDVLRRHFGACRSYSAKWSFAQWVAAEVARPPRGES